ncbi:hypothetical protein K469DRAFT_333928 [Zopfia rhizophila CBS 207.26]|uniref:Uncharacterized protein n=1 Tax=Zopfia rhizophila CBS 207.26 TaxID=1314779 RepID=A0A6A6DH15_9PEZI|nr:hypothetical protein K469DRAFT_333928 [Zopfia rhizophila CBS 207.26]
MFRGVQPSGCALLFLSSISISIRLFLSDKAHPARGLFRGLTRPLWSFFSKLPLVCWLAVTDASDYDRTFGGVRLQDWHSGSSLFGMLFTSFDEVIFRVIQAFGGGSSGVGIV